jgi:hypothetical protein
MSENIENSNSKSDHIYLELIEVKNIDFNLSKNTLKSHRMGMLNNLKHMVANSLKVRMNWWGTGSSNSKAEEKEHESKEKLNMEEFTKIQNETWQPHLIDIKEMLIRDKQEAQLEEVADFGFDEEQKTLVFRLSNDQVNLFNYDLGI